MKRHIPNLITGMNVISGTMAVFMAIYGRIELAAGFIILGMVFDFFDGLSARLLHVKSDMGKELDSLADIVSFGVAPALLAHFLMRVTFLPEDSMDIGDLLLWQQILIFIPVLIPFFSAFRLAKFNLDVRQSVSFIGMPVPAHALFWVSLVFAYYYLPETYGSLFGNIWVLAACVVVLSLLLTSELPMFSLKASGFGWAKNKVRYIYFLGLVLIAVFTGLSVVVFIIPFYIFLCAVMALRKVKKL